MKVAIIKYNAGNLFSVDYALKRLGIEPTITADKETLRGADKVIFPGVGEAETTMKHLKATGLDQLIKDLKQPVLGICLGMQLLCRHSEEGNTDCLGLFDIDVKKFQSQRHEDKVPHMGWNTITNVKGGLFNKQLENKASTKKSLYISCTAIMYRSTHIRLQPPNTSFHSAPHCTRTISMPPNFIRKRAGRRGQEYWPTF